MVQPNPLTWETFPEMDAMRFFSLIARVQQRTQRYGADECWTSTHSTETSGYHQISVTDNQGKEYKFRLHRLVYFLFGDGDLPEGQIVRHRCGNPACVNPGHLRSGSYLENAQDEVRYRAQEEGRIPPDADYLLRKQAEDTAFWTELIMSR